MTIARHTLKQFCTRMLIALILISAGVSDAHARSRSEVTALWLLNLERFIEWPNQTSTNLVISVIGDEEMASQLRTFLSQSARKDQVLVQSFERFTYQVELLDSSILFTSQSLSESHSKILNYLKSKSVFTISDSPLYIEQGGIMSLELYKGSISYSLNRSSAMDKKITIRSALLGRANRVIDQPFMEVKP